MTEIIAHRGDSANAPENTLRAFRRAIELGADRIELDLQRSVDGEVFVLHDIDLQRLAGHATVASELHSSELRALHILSDAHGKHDDTLLPSLDTVLEEIGARCPLYLEIKVDGAGLARDAREQLVDACIERITPQSEHVLASFDIGAVRRCLDAGRPTVLIASDPRRLGDLRVSEQRQLRAISLFHERINPPLLEQAASIELPVWAWTVDRDRDFERLLELGVTTAWCTNDVAKLSLWLRESR